MMIGRRCGMTSVISDERKIIFIHLTKTGGSSLEKILLTNPDFRPLLDTILVAKKQWYSMVKHDKSLITKVKTYNVDTIIRDSIDRYISAYNDFFHTRSKLEYCRAKVNFHQSLDANSMKGDYPGFYCHAYIPMTESLPELKYVDKIIKFECYEEEIRVYLEGLGIKYKRLPHIRNSRKVVIKEDLTQEEIDLLHNIFKQDYEAFHYV